MATGAPLIPFPVSVVIPTYRDGDALRRALQSVADQVRRPAETIVVDDAGGDPSVAAIVRDFAFLPAKLVSLDANVGPGGARNAGIDASNQPFVAFLDADDEWHPDKLTLQMAAMLAPDAPAFTTHPKAFSGVEWPAPLPLPSSGLRRRTILLGNPASISTVVMRRDAIRHVFPSWYACEDYAFVAANLLSGASGEKLSQTLARAHKAAFGASGLSARLLAMQLGEMRVHHLLWQNGLIAGWEYCLLLPWTLIKYARRLGLAAVRGGGALLGASGRSPR